MKKKIMALLICAAVTLSLTGCADSDNEKPNDSTPTSTSEKPENNSSSSDTQSSADNQSKPGQSSTTPEENSKPDEQEPMSGGEIDWDSISYANDKDFEYKDADGGIALTQYLGTEKIVKVPPAIDEKKVVTVNFPDFSGTDICIPDCVTGVSNGAFYESKTLISVTILGGSSIGEKAFNNCANLESVTLPSGITEIGADAFMRCIKLKSIMIPESVTSIGYQAFARCRQLTSVTIPDSVTSIDNTAFDDCNENIEITFKGKTYKYGDLDILYRDINNNG